MKSLRAGVAWCAVVLVAHARPAVASSCQKSCKNDLVACRRTECTRLDGVARRSCIEACGTRSTCTAPDSPIRTLAEVELPGPFAYQ